MDDETGVTLLLAQISALRAITHGLLAVSSEPERVREAIQHDAKLVRDALAGYEEFPLDALVRFDRTIQAALRKLRRSRPKAG